MKTKKEIYHQVSMELNLSEEVVSLAHKAMICFIRDRIHDLDFSDISKEELGKLKTSFNFPALGKLYTSMERIEGAKKRIEYLKKLKK